MNDSASIDTSELRRIAANINDNRDNIMAEYYSNIRNVMESSKECIQAAGIDFDSLDKIFRAIFADLNKDLTELTDTLTGTIIPRYEQEMNK